MSLYRTKIIFPLSICVAAGLVFWLVQNPQKSKEAAAAELATPLPSNPPCTGCKPRIMIIPLTGDPKIDNPIIEKSIAENFRYVAEQNRIRGEISSKARYNAGMGQKQNLANQKIPTIPCMRFRRGLLPWEPLMNGNKFLPKALVPNLLSNALVGEPFFNPVNKSKMAG